MSTGQWTPTVITKDAIEGQTPLPINEKPVSINESFNSKERSMPTGQGKSTATHRYHQRHHRGRKTPLSSTDVPKDKPLPTHEKPV